MLRSAIYARISKDAREEGLGVARQENECRKLAESLGWRVAEVYTDNDISASAGKHRPEYERLLSDIASGSVDAVLAWDLDRLTRRPAELEEFIATCDRAGVSHLATIGDRIDPVKGEGILVARIKGAVAAEEVRKLSERGKAKHRELAAAGKVSGGGRRPFGFEADRVTVRPDEAALIAEAAEALLAGESLRGIAYDWRERKVQTVTGAEWSPSTVRRLLRSGRISGQREHHGEIVGGAVWPAIITPEQTQRLRALLDDPGRNRAGGVVARSYLLTGWVRCGRCDVPMTTRPTGRGRRRYVCTKDRGGCDRCGIGAEPLEAHIVEAVMRALDSPALARNAKRKPAPTTDDARVVADLEQRLEGLSRDFYVDQVINRRMFLAARTSLDAELAAARRRMAAERHETSLDGFAGKAGALRAAWPDLTLDRRRAILDAVIDRIVIAPTVRANNRFDPTRVDVVWRM